MSLIAKKTEKIKRVLVGKVVKISSEKTIKVEVEKKFQHPLYRKTIKRHKRYLVHFEGDLNEIEIGNVVSITACTHISKRKSWRFKSILSE